jgi:hypothetical protein
MEKVKIDHVDPRPWTEYELDLLKSLMALHIPIEIISSELGRSWTETSLKALELGFNLFSWA